MQKTKDKKTGIKIFSEKFNLFLKKIFCSGLFLFYSILLIVIAVSLDIYILIKFFDIVAVVDSSIFLISIKSIPYIICAVGVNALWGFAFIGIRSYKSRKKDDDFLKCLQAYGDSYLSYKKIAIIFIVIISIIFLIFFAILIALLYFGSSLEINEFLNNLIPDLSTIFKETSVLLLVLLIIVFALIITSFALVISASLKTRDYFRLNAYLAFSTTAIDVEESDRQAPTGRWIFSFVLFLICAGLLIKFSLIFPAIILIVNSLHILITALLLKRIKTFVSLNYLLKP